MPLFYIPKPRRFHYEPRFYDPRKEQWEALKAKYALENPNPEGASDEELEYFEEKVRRMDELSTRSKSKLTWKDAFRKREMPQFNYTPRFDENGELKAANAKPRAENAEERLDQAKDHHVRIRRRFDASRVLQRKQQTVWIKVAAVLMVCYLVYRFYGAIVQFIYNLFY